jgi:2-methylcitrate dehydratase
MGSISQKMAEFVKEIEYGDLPEDVIREAKRFLIDSIGCAFAALKSEDMQSMYRVIQALGGKPEATIIGYGHRTNPPLAALMNNLLIRALDYNDIYWENDPSHPSDIIGTAISCAEANNKNGQNLILAIVIAYELMMRWCHAADPGIREVGWHHASLTQFVSPLVAGKLFDLNLNQLVAAVGISGSSHFTLGGVVAGHLTNMKNTADPMAAQAGVYAALMAREGYTGPVEVIEGKEGLIEVLSNVSWRTEELTRGLGTDYLITKCSYKAFPTEALTHQPISATLAICQRNQFTYEDVEEILVETTTRGADILSDPSKYQPETKETADHSLPYVIAVAAVEGHVLPKSFTEEAIRDPRIWELLPKIKVVADSEIDNLFPGVKRARVTITSKDGRVDTHQTDFAKGAPEDPLTDDELEAKFRANVEGHVTEDRLEEILRSSWDLQDVDNVADYVGLIRADVTE